jgi:hypothetical protein
MSWNRPRTPHPGWSQIKANPDYAMNSQMLHGSTSAHPPLRVAGTFIAGGR